MLETVSSMSLVSDQAASFLDRYFSISSRGSTIRTELIAGGVNFAANSYLLVVAPQILNHSGRNLDESVYLLGFILATAFSSITVGVLYAPKSR